MLIKKFAVRIVANNERRYKMKKILISVIGIFLLVSLASFIMAQGAQGSQDGIGQQTDNSGNGGGLQDNVGTGTGNQGEASELQNQIQEQNQVRSGEYLGEGGQQMQIQEKANNKIELKVGNSMAETSMKIMLEQDGEMTKLKTTLSNGKNAEIKVMPDAASEKALERLRLKVCSEENECSIELKEVGTGEQVKAVYEIKTQRQSKIFGLFKAKMQVQAQVDAETGEVIQIKKPWWAFLASEPAEE